MSPQSEWSRECPVCGTSLYYATEKILRKLTKRNGLCRSCAPSRRKQPKVVGVILDAHAKGLSNREIASIAECHHRTVAYHLKKHNLVTNRPRGKPPIEVSPTTAICTYCGREVAKVEFALLRSHKDGRRLSKCRQCRRERNYHNLRTNIAAYLRDRQNRLKNRVVKEGLEYNLPNGYLQSLYERQEGLCFYTDKALETTVGQGWNPKALSVDRVNPHQGYVVGNVVLCARRVNSIKQDMTLEELREWMPSWYSRVVEAFENKLICLQVADGDF